MAQWLSCRVLVSNLKSVERLLHEEKDSATQNTRLLLLMTDEDGGDATVAFTLICTVLGSHVRSKKKRWDLPCFSHVRVYKVRSSFYACLR